MRIAVVNETSAAHRNADILLHRVRQTLGRSAHTIGITNRSGDSPGHDLTGLSLSRIGR